MLEKQECYIDYLEQLKNTLNDTSIKFDEAIEQRVKDIEPIVPFLPLNHRLGIFS
ncbi:hypothetical protein [Helicobacter brantae]|uniref:hypothetical protein n=1 Tax=Helicobacter brantae TaxID=375927 RepID=UPI0014742CA6|nr:hypothetical protein [Helicobacter brantae]